MKRNFLYLDNFKSWVTEADGTLDIYFVKVGKIRNFQKMIIIIIIIIYQNGSGKPRKFSRSQMTKRTASLNSSRKI